MRTLLIVLVCTVLAAGAVNGAQEKASKSPNARAKPATTECGEPMAFQVLLDRRGFSTGEIDGTIGPNARRALAAFQQATGVTPSGMADCATWAALGGDGANVTTMYQVTEKDATGPFAPSIPADLVQQAKLPALSYRSVLERIGERFHVSPALITKLNPGTAIAAGATIEVPDVTPFDESVKPFADPAAKVGTSGSTAPKPASAAGTSQTGRAETPEGTAKAEGPAKAGSNAAAGDYSVEVSREGSLRVLRADGSVEFFAPVTSGSEHDPLPPGDWKVTAVQWMPKFNYNPALFWDAKPDQTRATIPAGPNNPVGVVWIDINVEHYGLHGTPEPSRIGHTQSHGCVRLTNWDAAHVAALVKVGTRVVFK